MLEQASTPAEVASGGRFIGERRVQAILGPVTDRLPARPTSPGSAGQGIFLLGLAAGLLAALAIERGVRYVFDRDLELVRTVRDLALEEYVHPVDESTLTDDALNGMLAGLDRYSTYYGPPQVAALQRETSGEFLGIGVVFRAGEPGRILFPYPGSPADRAGLRVGDLILRAGEQAFGELTSSGLQGLLRADTELRLEVEGLDGERRELALRPEVILDPTVRHARMLAPETGIGYLAIRSFSHRTPQEFDDSVAALREHGLVSLVLDLRDNPGGIVDAAVAVANRFVASGALVATLSRSETRVTEAQAERATLAGMPLLLLIDRQSASASEILAAALQDHAVAAVLGEPSYGKGLVQTLKRIGREQAVVKLTTARYCSPSLRRIEHEDDDEEHSGIAPDLWLPLSSTEREAVHRFLRGYSPPENARESLQAWRESGATDLLEPPPADRQLEAAVALLSGTAQELHGDPLH